MAETENGRRCARGDGAARCRSSGSSSGTFRSRTSCRKSRSRARLTPDIQVQVSLDARKRQAENQYEVIAKFKITSKNKNGDETLFLMELEYGGMFKIENVPDEQLHPFLLIECPRMLFPFVRRIVSDVTRDGGFPPLNLDNIDFIALYRQTIAQRQQAAAGRQAERDAGQLNRAPDGRRRRGPRRKLACAAASSSVRRDGSGRGRGRGRQVRLAPPPRRPTGAAGPARSPGCRPPMSSR